MWLLDAVVITMFDWFANHCIPRLLMFLTVPDHIYIKCETLKMIDKLELSHASTVSVVLQLQ